MAKTTHKIDILMTSLSDGARKGYIRSWKRWMSFCEGQQVPVWLDSREEGWGEALMDFIWSEHDVLGPRTEGIDHSE